MADNEEDRQTALDAIQNMNAEGVITFSNIELSELPPIPEGCSGIEIDASTIHSITQLPHNVRRIYIRGSDITTLSLPPNLTSIQIDDTDIEEVLNIPDTLETIHIEDSIFPLGFTFPANLKVFILRKSESYMDLPSPFPNSIQHIEITDVPLTRLPFIPLTATQHWDIYNLIIRLDDNGDRNMLYDEILYQLNENGVDAATIIQRLNAMRQIPQSVTLPTWDPPDTPVARALDFGVLTPTASPVPDPYTFYATPKEVPYTLAQFPMCFDIVMQEDVPVFDAISSGNIVFQVGGQYIATSMIELKKQLDDPLQTRYGCSTQKGLAVYKKDTDPYPYTMLQLTGNFLVSSDHLTQQIAQAIAFVFELVDTGKTLPYTVAEANIIDGENAGNVDLVSADHCQAGSERKVYGLQPLTFTFQRAQGGRTRNRRKTYRKRKNQKRTTTKKIGRKL